MFEFKFSSEEVLKILKNTKKVSLNRWVTKYQGGLWILVGALMFSVMNALAKYLPQIEGPDVLPLQLTFARYAIATIVLLPFMLARPKLFRASHKSRYFVRTLAGLGGIALMFLAIRHIPLASATAIGFTSPIFAMLFAAVLLRERIVTLRWLATMIGLGGAIIIAVPNGGSISFGSMIAIAAAIFMGAEIVSIKWLSQTRDHAVTILFYSNLAGSVLAFIGSSPILVWPNSGQFWILFMVGAVAVAGQICILRASRLSDASFLAPFFYISLFYSALIGFFAFDEPLAMSTTFGCAAILLSGGITMMTANANKNVEKGISV
ncbi:MAG: DMT family transporter [Pseudomonas marincola]